MTGRSSKWLLLTFFGVMFSFPVLYMAFVHFQKGEYVVGGTDSTMAKLLVPSFVLALGTFGAFLLRGQSARLVKAIVAAYLILLVACFLTVAQAGMIIF